MIHQSLYYVILQKKNMNIVYFVFGNDINYYQQVYFSIYTALAHKEESDQIIVMTEDSSFFKQLENRVRIVPINRNRITEWEGDYKYLFRIKIKALEFITKKFPSQPILYLDGDTFVYKSLSILKNELNKGYNLMHLNEGTLPKFRTKTGKKFWKLIKNKKFSDILIDENTCMWNSGVIGISPKHFETIPLALRITDEMCAMNITCFTMEQLSFALASSHHSLLKPADHIVGHYWGNKDQWNEVISNWIKKSMMGNLTAKEMTEEVKCFPFKEIPYYLKYSNTYKRLASQLKRVFKPKKAFYIQE